VRTSSNKKHAISRALKPGLVTPQVHFFSHIISISSSDFFFVSGMQNITKKKEIAQIIA
jgi:hypothetical protein